MTETTQYLHAYETPMGVMTATSDGKAVTGLTFFTPKEAGAAGQVTMQNGELPVFQELKGWLDTYFEGEDPGKAPPMRMIGTPFRLSVWQIVSEVPYGVLITYGEIARRLARQRGIPKMAALAVGNALGDNPMSLLIPCHRVIGAGDSLGGYGGNLDLKRQLLAGEGIVRNWNQN